MRRAPIISVALLSGAALAFELLLMRLFSIIQWHHFAYMVISLALLGYGVSGTFLTLAYPCLSRHFKIAYLANLLLFAIATVTCFLIAQRLSFNPEELLWDPPQFARLLGVYLLLALPFFFAANGIGLVLTHLRKQIARVYAADLVGAGLGGLLLMVLLYLATPARSLMIVVAAGLTAAAVACWELGLQRRWPVLIVAVALILLASPRLTPDLLVSPYKSLRQHLRVDGTHIVATRSSPLARLDVLESTLIPLRHAPGLSLRAAREPAAQLGIFSDAGGMTAVVSPRAGKDSLAYLDQLTSAAAYHLAPRPSVLLLGAGGGSPVWQARLHGAREIDAVELNPQVVDLVANEFADFAGNVYTGSDVQVHIAEARGHLAKQVHRYDLIQLTLSQSAGTGLSALAEGYLYTAEAFGEYLAHLAPGGMLSVSTWLQLPPRASVKLFATAVEALRRHGIEDPASRLALLRSLQTSTLLVKNGAFSNAEISALRKFCAQRAFDVAWYPGMPAAQANRYNVLAQPAFYTAATALLGAHPERFIRDYKFHIAPATDERPHFFRFYEWRTLPEILRLRGQGGMPLLESGYLIVIATLLQALVASLVLILLPIAILRGDRGRLGSRATRWPWLFYFAALGIAFLFVEIAFIQRLSLFLHHPVFAATTTISTFLVFAGIGSALSRRLAAAHGYTRVLRAAVVAIVLFGLADLLLLRPLFDIAAAWPLAFKLSTAIFVIAPLACVMGMPFPLGLARLGETAPGLIPWVWGVNGCASVLSAVLATLLAIHLGFSMVLLAALLLYIGAAVSFRAAAAGSGAELA